MQSMHPKVVNAKMWMSKIIHEAKTQMPDRLKFHVISNREGMGTRVQ